jgi:hypothetical protein
MSSIQPMAAFAPGVPGSGPGVCGNAASDGVCGRFRPLVAGESNHRVQDEKSGCWRAR